MGLKKRISISDFTFLPNGHGHYRVTYVSPSGFRKWSTVTDDMPLIDATKNTDKPKIKDLERLRRLCKEG